MLFRRQHRDRFSGYFFAISAVALWSGNFIVARGLSESIPPISLAFYRWVVAVIVFLPFALKPLLRERDCLRVHLPYLSLTAFLGVTLFNTLIYFAGHTTTALNLSLISITFPIFVVILSRIIYGERVTAMKGFGIVMVAAGVLLLITRGNISRLLSISFAIGDVWMLGAAVIFAIYSIVLKHKPEQLSIWALQLSTFILGLAFLLPFFIWESVTTPGVGFDQKIVGSILYVGIFASFASFVMWNKAIEMVGPSKAGMVYYTMPLFSGILGLIFLGEAIGIFHFYSLLFIVPGILIANYDQK